MLGDCPTLKETFSGDGAAAEDQSGDGPFILTANFRGSKASRSPNWSAVDHPARVFIQVMVPPTMKSMSNPPSHW